MAIYTPLYKTLNAVKQYKPSYQLGTSRRSAGGGMTPYEQELLPYVQQAQVGQERKRNWLQPIEFVFDLLSRGQYMTANTAKQITRNIREGKPVLEGVPREAWEGITGKEKGDWSTVLWGGADKGGEQFEGWGQKAGERLEKSWWGRRAKGGAALAANILLDPTTYIGFGPTTGARGAVKEVSEDAVKIASRKIAAEVSERLAREGAQGVSREIAEEALQQAAKTGNVKYLQKVFGPGRDINREMSALIKKTHKEALRQPAAQIRKRLLGEAESVYGRLEKSTLDIMAQGGRPYAEAIDVLTEGTPDLKSLSSIIKRIKSGEAYQGAGTRALRFMRKEFAAGERYPAIIKAWDKAGELVANSRVGSLFNNAWWAVMNDPKSPVATLKKALNFRTPYEQMLANNKLDKSSLAAVFRDEDATQYIKTVKGLKPEEKRLLTDVWSQIQKVPDANIYDMLTKSGAKPEQVEKLTKAHASISALFKKYSDRTEELYKTDPTLFPHGPIGVIDNYLPMVEKRSVLSGYTPPRTGISPVREGFFQRRTTTFPQQIDLEEKVWRIIHPDLDDAQINELLRTWNMGRYINLDLDQIVLSRIFAQARMEQNIAMIQQFRQFGLNMGEAMKSDNVIAEALTSGAADFGLVAIPDSRLEGYLFDPSTANILKNVTSVTQNDGTLRQFEKFFHDTTSWWKGWATLSPGFHIRNYISNNFTGFMKHGTEWFNPRTHYEAGVATLYGLYGEDAFSYFAKMGLSKDAAQQILKKPIGEHTLGELAQLARQRGIITRATMGFDIPATIEEFTKQANLNPLSTRFAPMKASRNVGTIIESQPRFMSFYLDYARSAGQGVAGDAALDLAGWEAKKWFIDYTDLSEFEQKVMKNIIPFYSWLRKNTANQLAGMLEFKEMYSLIPKLTEGGPETEGIPEYMRNVGYFPIRELMGDKAGLVQMLWPNLPYMDINKIPLKFEMTEAGIPIPKFEGKEILNDVLSNAHPAIKTAFEIVPEEGWDVYYRRPLGEEGEAPKLLSKLSSVAAANPRILQFLDGFLVNIGVDEGLSGSLDDKGRLMINAKLARILDNNIPFLQKLNQYIEMPEYLIEAIRAARMQTEDEKDKMLRAEKGLRVLSFYAGIKLRNIDEEAELGKQSDTILREAEEALRKERKKRPQYKQAQLKTIRSKLLRKQRLGISG